MNHRSAAKSHTPIMVVHPAFLYVLLDSKLRLGHGRASKVYVAGHTLGRCWIELMRSDDATHVFGVRINVWTSILVVPGRGRVLRAGPASRGT